MSTSARNRRAGNQSRVGWLIAGAVVVLVALAAAIALSQGDDDPDVAEGVEQTRPVQVTGAALVAYPASGADPAIGSQSPTLEGASFDGTPVSIGPGSPTLVVVLAHWCPHCQVEVPGLVQWEEAGAVPEGLNVFGIASGTDSGQPNYPPSAWLEREGFPWPVMADSSDGAASVALGLTGFPYFVLLDADGKVKWRISGEVDTDQLATLISSALAT